MLVILSSASADRLDAAQFKGGWLASRTQLIGTGPDSWYNYQALVCLLDPKVEDPGETDLLHAAAFGRGPEPRGVQVSPISSASSLAEWQTGVRKVRPTFPEPAEIGLTEEEAATLPRLGRQILGNSPELLKLLWERQQRVS